MDELILEELAFEIDAIKCMASQQALFVKRLQDQETQELEARSRDRRTT